MMKKAGIASLALLAVVALATAIASAREIVLLDPAAPVDQVWSEAAFGSKTEYSRVEISGVAAIRAVGQNSASGLHREVRYRPEEHPWLEWSWRVDKLQQQADIRDVKREDFGAAIFVIFGRPSLFHRNVPTLSYVWTNARVDAGDVVVNPHHRGTSRSIVLRAGGERLGRWQRERRNVLEDYRRAFGADPPETVEMIALWTDNDQTGDPVEAYYGRMVARSR
jgi:hypothetical protein